MARRKNRKQKDSGKKIYSIIVDGETEVWYFQMMKRYEKLLSKVKIQPELSKKKSLKGQYETVAENIEKGYDKVIWVLDFDTIVKESRDVRKAKNTTRNETMIFIPV